ncbi:MAG: chromosome partitioning protein ParB [Sphingomonadaceae bacterium]|nr:chromosome partitioning protein ParB [Sphingomonadaceae bacterium]
MTIEIEPLLHPVAIDDLRPTQMTVGYREVERKRRDWETRTGEDRPDYLGRHMIPVVLGPKQRFWLIDNHHLARALHEEGVGEVLVRVVADLHKVHGRLFRTYMDNRNWLHPFDAKGRRRAVNRIPKHVADLADDPYRSLAGELRRVGGFAKDQTPFSEFLWADYLRRHVGADLIEKDFAAAVRGALELARKTKADYLPGWAGPED